MHWNHRVCKERCKGRPDITTYTIREVYYNDDGSITGVTEDAIGVYADDEFYHPEPLPSEREVVGEMKVTLERMLRALEKPVVDLDTIEYAKWNNEDETD